MWCRVPKYIISFYSMVGYAARIIKAINEEQCGTSYRDVVCGRMSYDGRICIKVYEGYQ